MQPSASGLHHTDRHKALLMWHPASRSVSIGAADRLGGGTLTVNLLGTASKDCMVNLSIRPADIVWIVSTAESRSLHFAHEYLHLEFERVLASWKQTFIAAVLSDQIIGRWL